MPADLAGLRVVRLEIAVRLDVEDEAAGCGRRSAATFAPGVGHAFLPDDFPRSAVDCGHEAVLLLAGQARRSQKHPRAFGATDPRRIDADRCVEIAGLRTVGHRRLPHVHVRQVEIRRLDRHGIEIAAGDESRREHVFVHAARSDTIRANCERLRRRRMQERVLLHRPLVDRQHRFSRFAIEIERDAVGTHGRHHLARTTGDVRVVEDERRADVVLPDIVMHELVVPADLSGLQIERDDRVVEQVVAGADFAAPLRHGIAGFQIHQSEIRIDRRRCPQRAAAVFPDVAVLRPRLVARFARSRHDFEFPQARARLPVEPERALLTAFEDKIQRLPALIDLQMVKDSIGTIVGV